MNRMFGFCYVNLSLRGHINKSLTDGFKQNMFAEFSYAHMRMTQSNHNYRKTGFHFATKTKKTGLFQRRTKSKIIIIYYIFSREKSAIITIDLKTHLFYNMGEKMFIVLNNLYMLLKCHKS
jgi:hypothetical protein